MRRKRMTYSGRCHVGEYYGLLLRSLGQNRQMPGPELRKLVEKLGHSAGAFSRGRLWYAVGLKGRLVGKFKRLSVDVEDATGN